eukprot:CAMPEP_0194041208 /NCGR_PEP_ID=MMETSP0009_2-20130614/13103_1 /TAXON_ID=210454 /ORGANISM="Grammatophora oceanica, Strain CCMP 410" /LENGTH=383 /DNA_ID=CAMNT_0038684601 /DNA_START=227 /DNA_END=1378 /DNA_ORIENTATION=+
MTREKDDCRVLFGRSKEAFHNPGNIKFRQTISLSAPDYLSAGNRRNRSKVVVSVWEYLLIELKAEFYKLGSKRQWIRVSDREAKDKVSHALRDAARFEQRGNLSPSPKLQRPSVRTSTPPSRAATPSPPPSPMQVPTEEPSERRVRSREVSEIGVETSGVEHSSVGAPRRNKTDSSSDVSRPFRPKSSQGSSIVSPMRKQSLPITFEKCGRTNSRSTSRIVDERYEVKHGAKDAFEPIAIDAIPVQGEDQDTHPIPYGETNSNSIITDCGDDDWNEELDQVLDGWTEATQAQTRFITPDKINSSKPTRSISESDFFAAMRAPQLPDIHFMGSIEPTPFEAIVDHSLPEETKVKGSQVRRSRKTEIMSRPFVVQSLHDIEPLPI